MVGFAEAKLPILRARKRQGWCEILGGIRGKLCIVVGFGLSKAPDSEGAKKARLHMGNKRSWRGVHDSLC